MHSSSSRAHSNGDRADEVKSDEAEPEMLQVTESHCSTRTCPLTEEDSVHLRDGATESQQPSRWHRQGSSTESRDVILGLHGVMVLRICPKAVCQP